MLWWPRYCRAAHQSVSTGCPAHQAPRATLAAGPAARRGDQRSASGRLSLLPTTCAAAAHSRCPAAPRCAESHTGNCGDLLVALCSDWETCSADLYFVGHAGGVRCLHVNPVFVVRGFDPLNKLAVGCPAANRPDRTGPLSASQSPDRHVWAQILARRLKQSHKTTSLAARMAVVKVAVL